MSVTAERRPMPELVRGTRLTRHDALSAIATLAAAGVSLDEIVLRYAPGAAASGEVVEQEPAAGALLDTPARIVLTIAGAGTELALPYALRDHTDDPRVFGVAQLSQVLDVALARTRTFVQQGGGHFFRLAPERPETATRWLRDLLFVGTASWTPSERYRLARLVARLPELAGRPRGIPTALRAAFDLPVQRTRLRDASLPLSNALRTRLGIRNGRLGIDAVVGDGLVVAHTLDVHIGPVSLQAWRTQYPRAATRQALYRLLVPAYLGGGVREHWVVEPRAEGYRLGDPQDPALLAVSSYLGAAPPPVVRQD
jgi:hypothetical protein